MKFEFVFDKYFYREESLKNVSFWMCLYFEYQMLIKKLTCNLITSL